MVLISGRMWTSIKTHHSVFWRELRKWKVSIGWVLERADKVRHLHSPSASLMLLFKAAEAKEETLSGWAGHVI